MNLQSLDIYLLLSLGLFTIGLVGVLFRRSALFLLMSIELMLNGVTLALVAFSRYHAADFNKATTGHVLILVITVVAVIEAAVGIALIVSLHRQTRGNLDIKLLGELKG